MKPNQVVRVKKDETWIVPMRIWKQLPDGRFLVLSCLKHIEAYYEDELEPLDYKGRWDMRDTELRRRFPVYYRFPSLRKLKQITSGYHPDIWKRKRPKGTIPKGTSFRGRVS